ncbi:MAG: Gfo/Idh/MocA family protein [Syntrophorhabdaceae bacterium]
MKKVLIVGYGSIGKRHARNLIMMGIKPIVLSQYPDDNENISFINQIGACDPIDYCIIATPTANHYRDIKNIWIHTACKHYLIEKPIESNFKKAKLLYSFATKNALSVHIAYNMRFINVFEEVKTFLNEHINQIRLVKITAGQYLPDWRSTDYKLSYSAKKKAGGGVHLDLSHEIDYMHWLFGSPKKILISLKKKISGLEIDSVDYFKGLYEYPTFIVDVELDYFRKLERSIRFIGEKKDLLFLDFIGRKLFIHEEEIIKNDLFNHTGYVEELKEFLEIKPRKKICSIEEGLKIMGAI